MMTETIERMRAVAMQAARAAGAELARRFQGPLQTREKGLRDIVTDADLASERIILKILSEMFPTHAILAEESGASPAGSEAPYRWVIDPLDGTTNYARGISCWCVSIAAAAGAHGAPVLGVIYDPLRDQMYHATRGAGAFLGTRRLLVSAYAERMDAIVATGWPRKDHLRRAWDRRLLEISPQIGSWRGFGSAALEMCYVAEGIVEAYALPTLMPWDIAAGGLIVEEAGGRASGLRGESAWWEGPTCLASNGLLHEDLLALFHWETPAA